MLATLPVSYRLSLLSTSTSWHCDTKPATINHVLAAGRGRLREAWRLGLIDAETLARVVDIGNVSASTLPAGCHVDVGEVRRLFEPCGDNRGSARDAAMPALLYGSGLRRSEAVAQLLDRYDHAATRTARIPRSGACRRAGWTPVRHGCGRPASGKSYRVA